MKAYKVLVAALALLLSACTPSLNLDVALPEITGPGFTVDLEAGTATGPAPLVVEFSADARESAAYAWYVNDRQLARDRGLLTYTFTEVGSYQVTVAATNAVGDTDTDTVTVEVTDAQGDAPAVESL